MSPQSLFNVFIFEERFVPFPKHGKSKGIMKEGIIDTF
jgi:hypothetical protein